MALFHSSKARSAFAVVFNQEGDCVLLVKRKDVPIWTLPGGGVDLGETPEAAVLREIEEETGLCAIIARPVAIYSPVNRLTNETFLFKCTALTGTPLSKEETSQVDFFSIDSLPPDLFFIHLDWIRDTLSDQRRLICIPLQQATYWKIFCYFCRHPLQTISFILSRIRIN